MLGGGFSIAGDSAFANSGFGAFSGVAVGQADTAPTVKLDLSATGTFTETITVDPTSANASGYSGALTPETLTITGTVIAPAATTINTASPVEFGAVRVGDSATTALSITNTAAAGAGTLAASAGSAAGAGTVSGSFSHLGAGQTDATDVLVGFAPTMAGPQSSAVTVNFASDGATSGPSPLPNQSVVVEGTGYRKAAPVVTPVVVHPNDPGQAVLSVTNADPSDGYSENLIGNLVGVTGGVTASGIFGAESAPGSTSNGIALAFSTAAVGTAGTAILDFQTDGTGLDGFGPTDLGQARMMVSKR